MNLEQWLAQHPELTAPPGAVGTPEAEVPVWVEQPDDACCYCCNGTGLVADAVMRQYINADYDPIMSPPVRCLRSPVCGGETRTFTDGELGPRRVRVRRYENVATLPLLPTGIADDIHRTRKAVARELALDPDRQRDLPLRLAIAREGIERLSRQRGMS